MKQFLDGKHDRKLADSVSTPETIVSKILKEKYFWSYAEMKRHSSCHVGLQVITISAEGFVKVRKTLEDPINRKRYTRNKDFMCVSVVAVSFCYIFTSA